MFLKAHRKGHKGSKAHQWRDSQCFQIGQVECRVELSRQQIVIDAAASAPLVKDNVSVVALLTGFPVC